MKATGYGADEAIVGWRLQVCAECPKRREAKTLLEKSSVALSGQFKDKDVCDVCGCSLALLTSAPNSLIHDDTPEQRSARPQECWIHCA